MNPQGSDGADGSALPLLSSGELTLQLVAVVKPHGGAALDGLGACSCELALPQLQLSSSARTVCGALGIEFSKLAC